MRGAKRSIAIAAAAAVTACAWPVTAAEAVFPTSLEGEPLTDWMRRETDIRPAQVIAISPSALTAVIASYPTTDPLGMRVVVRAEALSPLAQGREGVLSWHVSVQTDCANRRVRMGETTGYAGRNLIGEGRMIRPLETDWRTALPDTPLDSIWRLACDRSFRRPLSPQTESIALAGVGGPIKTAPREIRAVDPTPPAARPPPRATPLPATPPAARPPPVRAAAPAVPTSRAPTPPAPEPRTPEPRAQAPAGPPPKMRPAVTRTAPVSPAAVQISATSSEAAARKDLATLKARLGPAVAARTLKVEPVQAGGRTLYRALVTGFSSAGEAGRFCEALKGRGQGCFVRAGG